MSTLGVELEHLITRKAYSGRVIAAIHRRQPDRDYEPKLDGGAEPHLVALACSEPPEGRTRWTQALFADRLVTLEKTESNSNSEETVRQRVNYPTLLAHG